MTATDDTGATTADRQLVRLTIARDQLEADQVCSMLRSEGILAMQRMTDMSVGGVMMPGVAGAIATVVLGGAVLPGEFMRGTGGYRDVLVQPERLADAQELLIASPDVDFSPHFGPEEGS